MAAPKLGNGATITYSGLTGECLSISLSLYNREAKQTSHLGTTAAHTFIPDDLYDPGEVTAEYHTTTGVAYGTPATAAASNLVVAWDSAVSITASAFVTNMEFNIALGEVQTFSTTWKLTGAITIDSTP